MFLIRKIFKSFLDDECFTLSSGISFCALLAVIPLTMLMVSIAGYFLGSQGDEVFRQITNGIVDVLPVGRDDFITNMRDVMDKRSSLGLIGIGTLVFISTILVSSIEHAFDTIFRSVKRRNFFHSRLIGIIIIFSITLLFFVPTVARVFESFLVKYGFNFPFVSFFTADAFMFALPFLAFVMVVVVVPNQKVYIRYAAVGGIIFSLGIGIAKLIFHWYTSFALTRYSLIYGSFTAIILFIMWIYYISNIMLLSAEVVMHLQSMRRSSSEITNGGSSIDE